VSVSAAAIAQAARDRASLRDFGEGPWDDGLAVLCDSLNSEANLNAMGRAVFDNRLTNLLAQRLHVVDWQRNHPEIGTQEIRRPVVVIGLPRTGTTALAHLLAADPDNRSLRTWESSTPTPPPESATQHTDVRIAATQAGIDMSHQLMPDLPRMYFATATSPSEALDLTGMSMRAFQFSGQAHVPAYEDWLLDCDMTGAYQFQRGVHQLLQWKCGPTRWTWKNPSDILFLPALRAVFPDAAFIWTHRDPFAALVSVCSLIAVVSALATDEVDRSGLGPRQTELWAQAVERGMAVRAQIGEDAFVDMGIDDLSRDAIGTMAAIYARLGWPFTEQAERSMRAYLAHNPRHGRGANQPDPNEFGLDAAAVRERFTAYRQQFASATTEEPSRA
jgi:hypothetical protein